MGNTLDAILSLYRLPELLDMPDVPVLVVEGEKAADRASAIWPDYACTCPVGGSGPAPTSWWPVTNRRVMVLGDNDDAGRLFTLRIRDHIAGSAANVSMLQPQDVFNALGGDGAPPPGWDVADWDVS